MKYILPCLFLVLCLQENARAGDKKEPKDARIVQIKEGALTTLYMNATMVGE